MDRHAMQLLAAATAAALAAGCTPTPNPGGGVTTACTFPANQTGQDLRTTCTVTGSPPNTLVNPLSGGSGCAADSLALFGQAITVTGATLIWGENGDDSSARVRIGVIVPAGSTHTGSLAKAAGQGCGSTIGPVAAVTTTFGGRHIALIDKGRTPMCVFQSRFDPTGFTQTIAAGLSVDASAVTRASTLAAIARQLDLEAASAANRLLGQAGSMDAAFRARFGRCPGDHATFVGP